MAYDDWNLDDWAYGNAARRRIPEDRVALTPDDEKSLLSSIAEKGGSALQAVGTVLDTPGSVVRGLIAGEPGRAFGGIFDPEQRVQAEELTGWKSNPDDDWMTKAGRFAGNTAVNVALDPLTYLTFGASALGKAGQVAKSADLLNDATTLATRSVPGVIGKRTARLLSSPTNIIEAMPEAKQAAALDRWNTAAQAAGHTTEEAAQLAGEKLGGLVGVGLPFQDPLFTIGHGQAAQKAAAMLDKAGNAVRWSAPGRNIAALMDAKVMGTKTRLGQENAAMLYHELPRAEAEAMRDVNDVGRLIDRLGLTSQDEGAAKLRALLEAKGPTAADSASALDNAIYDIAQGDEATSALARQLRETHDIAHAKSLQRQQEIGVGTSTPYQDPYANYMTRHFAGPRRSTGAGGASNTFGTQLSEETGRQEFLNEAKGGTNTLRQIISDPLANQQIKNGGTLDDVAATLKSKYADAFDTPTYQTREDIAKATSLQNAGADPLAIEKEIPPRDRFQAIAAMMAGMPEDMRLSGGFSNHPLLDFSTARVGANRAIERGNTVLETLAQPGVIDRFVGKVGRPARIEGTVPMTDVLTAVGIRQDEGLGRLADLLGMPRTPESIAKLKTARVNEDIASDLGKINERFAAPKAVSELGRAIDSASNLWKSGVTAFPAFHARNFGGGQVQSLLNFGPKALGEVGNVARMMQGQDVAAFINHPEVIKEAARLGIENLDAHQATNIMRELVQRHSVLDRYSGEVASRAGDAANQLGGTFADYADQFSGGLGGKSPSTVGKFINTLLGREEGTTLKPFTLGPDKHFNIRGVGETTESTFAPLAANEMLGNTIESTNRIPSWIAMTRNGVDPVQAKRLVDSAQVAYTGRHFTPFEQNIIGRLFPFYKFGKGMATHTMKTLAEKPGGALGQVIKAEGNLSDNSDVMLPDYLKSSMTIPIPEGTPLIGPEPGGAPRYMTGFGLMHEQDPFGFMGNGIQGAGLELLSRMNPLIKGPIEYAMGHSAFQRGPGGPRALEDQDPLIGRLIQNVSDSATGERTRDAVKFPGSQFVESVAGNSPLSRALSTARTLADPRKSWVAAGLNTLTGARVTDVPERTQEALIGEQLRAMMKDAGARDFENVYFSKAQLADMTPDMRAQALRYQALKQTFAKKQRDRAKAAALLGN